MKYDIVLVVGGLAFNSETVKTGALGGSESAGYYMANALADLGHEVKIFCDCGKIESVNGVTYLPIDMARSYTTTVPHDILISQRDPSYLAMFQSSKVNILWNHDLALGRFEAQYKSSLWNVDKYFVLSEFHKQQYKDAMRIDDSLMNVTRNGIDLDTINKARDGVADLVRDPKQLVFSSRPERGLDILLSKVMPKLLQVDPEYKLVIAGYDNPQSELGEFYKECNKMADDLGDSVIRVGGLNKEDLYRLFWTSGAYVYPSPSPINANFAEISCITAMEAMACGLPFIGSNKGALVETLNENACVLLDGDPSSDEYIDSIVMAIIDASSYESQKKMRLAGIEHAKTLEWSGVAVEWEQLFDEIISEKNNDPVRFVNSAEKYSDIMVALKVAEENDLTEQLMHLREKYYFIESDAAFKSHYEMFDDPEVYTLQHLKDNKGTIRYHEIKAFIDRNNFDLVCDYGCNAGGFTTHLADDFPETSFTGYDINKNMIDVAITNAKEITSNDNLEYYTSDNLPNTKQFDLMICQEVLEHVAEPWKLVDRLEESVADGGTVYLTVPFGPWEFDSFDKGERFHLWHFDIHDFQDMFNDKANMDVRCVTAGASVLGVPCGWWIITYNKNGAKTGVIDMERKAKLAAPLQTVSAVMIVGGDKAAHQLHWCLSSFRKFVDELIIVDCGMNAETLRIASQYSPTILKGVDPKVEGFDTARNIGVKAAKGDFVLWIDSDEHILGAENITKYLRTNMFDGYSIRQHHFAVDTTFPADMPVRMFRNHRGIDFVGKIHEHPEREMNEGPGEVIVLSDVNIAHTGYLTENIRRARFVRNLPMLNLDVDCYPDRLLQKHFLIRDNMLLVQYQLAENGNIPTTEILQRCYEVVNIYNDFIKGNKQLAHIDSLQWYTMANEILNRGIKVKVTLNVNDEEYGFDGRFGSLEEAEAEMKHILHDTSGKFEQEHY